MNLESFLILLTVLSVATSLITQGIKKMLGEKKVKYASNILAACVAVVVGGVGTAVFYLFNGYDWTATNIVVMFLLMLANWLGAMLGYDKVKQSILQIANK